MRGSDEQSVWSSATFSKNRDRLLEGGIAAALFEVTSAGNRRQSQLENSDDVTWFEGHSRTWKDAVSEVQRLGRVRSSPADAGGSRVYLFCTCTRAFCRFLLIEPIEFSKSFEKSTIVADRLPPPTKPLFSDL